MSEKDTTPTNLKGVLFAIKKRGRWLDSWSSAGRFRANWTPSLGCACLFTRESVARKAASKSNGVVFALIPSRLP